MLLVLRIIVLELWRALFMYPEILAARHHFRKAICCAVFALVMVHITPGHAGEFHNALSLQGFTGLLNTPNAEVTAEGRFYGLFSDQKESKWRNKVWRQENYMFSVGLFSFAELGGRLTEARGVGARDLSGNVKLKIPFIPEGRYLPAVALGVQDIGGGEHRLRTAYAVATEELWRMRFSIGYGTGSDRMKGVFGGGELKVLDWIYLLGEYDTTETNVAARLITPEVFGIPVNFQVTAKTSLTHRPGNFELGVGLQFPLGLDHFNKKPLSAVPEEAALKAADGQAAPPQRSAAASGQEASVPEDDAGDVVDGSLLRLQERLVAQGFRNVRVGRQEMKLLVIEYENSRFNHNEMDGLGVVSGTAVIHSPAGFENLRLILKKKNIRVMQLEAPLNDFRMFLEDAGKLEQLRESLQVTTDAADDEGVRYVAGSANPSRPRASLLIHTGLKTFVGTEVGVFDYLLSIRPDLYVDTWKGSVVNARWDIPVSWSENFDNGKTFRSSRENSRLDRLMLFQAIKVSPTIMANVGGGMLFPDAYGTLNELLWTPGSGTHRFSLTHAFADDSKRHATHEVYLGAYRYYFSPLELYLEGTGGRFRDQDNGFKLTLKRFFGDTSFSVYYKNSETADRQHVQMGGVQIAFPLTPRKDMKPYPLQVRGSDEWSYAQEVVIAVPGQRNPVGKSIGVDSLSDFNLERVFYNRDRLSGEYIKKHLLRLRDAYAAYVPEAGRFKEAGW